MIIEFKGKEKEFRFDKVGFVRRLDSIYKAEKEGVEFGFGIVFADMHLEQASIPQLTQILKCGSVDKKLTITDIDEMIEDMADEDIESVEQLFVDVQEEMGKSGIIRATRNSMEKMEAKAKEQAQNKQN